MKEKGEVEEKNGKRGEEGGAKAIFRHSLAEA